MLKTASPLRRGAGRAASIQQDGRMNGIYGAVKVCPTGADAPGSRRACLGRLADFGRRISRRIVPKRNPTFRWRLGPRGGLQSWKGIEWARGGQAHFSDPGRQSRRDSPCPAHSHIQQASLGRLPAHVVSNSGDWSGVLIAGPSVHDRNGLRSTMSPKRTFLVRFKCIMSGPSCRFRT